MHGKAIKMPFTPAQICVTVCGVDVIKMLLSTTSFTTDTHNVNGP